MLKSDKKTYVLSSSKSAFLYENSICINIHQNFEAILRKSESGNERNGHSNIRCLSSENI